MKKLICFVKIAGVWGILANLGLLLSIISASVGLFMALTEFHILENNHKQKEKR
jgi:hypothetical protein